MKTITVLMILGILSSTAGANSWEPLVQKLTQTRAELETLSKDTESLQREKQAELDQWLQRRSDLEAQVEKEKLRQLQLSEKLKRLEGRVKTQGRADPEAQQKIRQWISQFEKSISGSIPFQQESRLQTLARLKERAARAHESSEFVMADLWDFVESEMKLAKSNEYKVVDITLQGAVKKCEVARLGLQALFVVAPDKKIYQAVSTGEKWTWKDIESVEEKESIRSLVSNLKNKNDSGYYHLPVNNAKMGASL